MTPLFWKWNINHSSTPVKTGNLEDSVISTAIQILTLLPRVLFLTLKYVSGYRSCGNKNVPNPSPYFLMSVGFAGVLSHSESWWSRSLKAGFLLYSAVEATATGTYRSQPMRFFKSATCVCECGSDQLMKTGSYCAEEKPLAKAVASKYVPVSTNNPLSIWLADSSNSDTSASVCAAVTAWLQNTQTSRIINFSWVFMNADER